MRNRDASPPLAPGQMSIGRDPATGMVTIVLADGTLVACHLSAEQYKEMIAKLAALPGSRPAALAPGERLADA